MPFLAYCIKYPSRAKNCHFGIFIATTRREDRQIRTSKHEMRTVCQQLVKTCLYLSEQQAKLQTAVSSNTYPQQQGGQQPPQAQPPQQPSSFPPQPSNQYPQQYQQPTAQAQSQAPQAKPQQGMLAQGPSQGVNPAQSTWKQRHSDEPWTDRNCLLGDSFGIFGKLCACITSPSSGKTIND